MISYKEIYVFSFKGVCHQAKICETAGSMKFTSNMRKRDLKKSYVNLKIESIAFRGI